ncbi:MAG TPA: hypothetical protein VF221_04025, partial [Chloroflexota bacterium]
MGFPRLTSVRGQLVLWYVGALAAVLIALGIFQSIRVGDYLRSAMADNMRSAAAGELTVLGPCFMKKQSDLTTDAETLAQLLGSHDTAVKIVSKSGAVLADHGMGPPGATRPLRLSGSTIHQLIQSAQPVVALGGVGAQIDLCSSSQRAVLERQRLHAISHNRHHSSLEIGNRLLIALPLGPPGQIFGFAILGRSL